MERPVLLYQNSSDKLSAEHESSPTEWCVMWNDCKGSSYSFAANPRGIQGATTTSSRSTTSRPSTDWRIEWHDSSPFSAPGFNRGAHAREASLGQEAKWFIGRKEPLPSSAAGAATGSRKIGRESKEAEQETRHIEWYDSSSFASFLTQSAVSSFDSPAGPVGLVYTSPTGSPETRCEIEWHGACPWAETVADAHAAECVCVLLPDGSVQLFPSSVFHASKGMQQVAASDVLSLFPSHSLLPVRPPAPGASGVAHAPAAAALSPAQQLSSSCVYELVQTGHSGHARSMQPPDLSSHGGAHCSRTRNASAGYSCKSPRSAVRLLQPAEGLSLTCGTQPLDKVENTAKDQAPRCLAHWPLRGLLRRDCVHEKEHSPYYGGEVETKLVELQWKRRTSKEQEPFSVPVRQPSPRGSSGAPKDESNNRRRWGMFYFGSAKSILQSTPTGEHSSMAEEVLHCSQELAGNRKGHPSAVPQGLVKGLGYRRRALLRSASGW